MKDLTTQQFANKIRLYAVRMTNQGKSSHIGSILSIADILAVLYGSFLRVDPKLPKCPKRDRFILSKGHAGAGVYAALAIKGFFSEELLMTHYQDGSNLSGHVSHKGIAGVEFSTGSLGHGLSVGTGMALNAKLAKQDHNVCVLLSDGECDEGSNWEAIMFAAHHKLSNLIAIIDYNKLQSLTSIKDTLNLEPFVDKWESFGWNVIQADGHNHCQLKDALNSVRMNTKNNKPTCIIADTTKGKGVSFMENNVLWHYKTPDGEFFEKAIQELEEPK